MDNAGLHLKVMTSTEVDMNTINNFHRGILIFAFTVVSLLIPQNSYASRYLLFAEAQGVAGYSSETEDLIYYSHHQHAVMQKPSLGFDYIQRLGSVSKDYAVLAVQARLAYDNTKDSNLEPQLYNAYLKLKLPYTDLWIGHNKPAMGLNSYLDNHATLTSDLSMVGFGFDRDWGTGIETDLQHWNFKLSATTGSGMALKTDGSYLLATRVARGDLKKENYTVGVTALKGKVLESMGYQIMHNNTKHTEAMIGFDLGYRYLNYELKADLLGGSFYHQDAYAGLLRATWYPGSEDRTAIEPQIMLYQMVGDTSRDYSVSVSHIISPEFSVKAMYDYSQSKDASKLVLQVYYYHNLQLFKEK
ncbi:MAG: hypothetical protein CVU48_07540 [Candidatus Cloacimonetes bacterium HGW-Cloacimonetes-1]|jgi:hypothetical protein|nr:MAG: hypothetical protein CVU48_07540 [Candidatus Cloacimonetes bacterium HGW-Cloacimonetes-1]